MLKLIIAARRRSDLSPDAFKLAWQEHGDLVRRHAAALNLQRYVQNRPTSEEGLQEALRRSRGGEEPFDGVAEAWWDDLHAFQLSATTPEGKRATKELIDDEKRFVDHSRCVMMLVEEKDIDLR